MKPSISAAFAEKPPAVEARAQAPIQQRAPLAHSIPEVCKLTGLGRTTIYAAIKSGHLVARRYRRRTVVLSEDLRRFLIDLPQI